MNNSVGQKSRSSKVALGLVAVMLFLSVAATYNSLLIMRQQAALKQVSRYNLTWLVSQAGLEVARLYAVTAAALVPGSESDADEVELRLEIVENRLQLLVSGEVADFVASSPEYSHIVTQFRNTLAAIRREVDAPGGLDRLRSVLDLVQSLQSPLAHLSAAANTRGGNLVANDQRSLSDLFWTFAAILIAITLCGFGLVVALAFHNRLLTRERDRGVQQNELLHLRDIELIRQNARFNAALDNMSQALCMVDSEQHLIVSNARFQEMFGLRDDEVIPGGSARDVFKAVTSYGRYGTQMLEAIFTRQFAGAQSLVPVSFIEHDESDRAIAVSQEPMGDGGWVATFEDITERRRADARINYMAHHDSLTNLPNRAMFHASLGGALERFRQCNQTVAVICLDLDQFKQVNDTLGHPAGDTLLQAVALRLQNCVRDSDLIVRLGGDEFAVLQQNVLQPMSARALAARIVDEIGLPFDIDGHRIMIGTSIGIAIASPALDTVDQLLKSADIALYRAKDSGRGRFLVFETAMDTEMQARRAFEADLRGALGRGEFEMFYQPLYNLAQERVCGFEALLRWRHPERGMVAPGIFIPIAEELGLIIEIGRWALHQACSDAAAWPDHVKVAVNLSPVQFQDATLVATVERALVLSSLPASRLELEITESALLQDSKTVLDVLKQFRELGLRIALDDFGTGYSSLSYLRSFPFSKLKIDQSFIREIAIRSDCEAIVRSVADLAATLHMTTTAEGVETDDQLARLRDVGCTEVQGYFFDRPRPVGDIRRWFDAPQKPHLLIAS